MGKGDKRRPTQVDEDTFASRWAKTFGDKGRSAAGAQVSPGATAPGPSGETTPTEPRQRAPDPDLNPNDFDSKREDT